MAVGADGESGGLDPTDLVARKVVSPLHWNPVVQRLKPEAFPSRDFTDLRRGGFSVDLVTGRSDSQICDAVKKYAAEKTAAKGSLHTPEFALRASVEAIEAFPDRTAVDGRAFTVRRRPIEGNPDHCAILIVPEGLSESDIKELRDDLRQLFEQDMILCPAA
ncbi:MAG: hypothetical protein RLO51_26175 [Thalassobaculum sp.]|uniref:hypothetical protein n=1 Tax=Thalassobaculum sp. TaxID=2022740 RepID=UPI0032EF439E